MISPSIIGLPHVHSATVQRGTLLVVRLVQQLANRNPFHQSFMAPLNSFIDDAHLKQLDEFLDLAVEAALECHGGEEEDHIVVNPLPPSLRDTAFMLDA